MQPMRFGRMNINILDRKTDFRKIYSNLNLQFVKQLNSTLSICLMRNKGYSKFKVIKQN